MKRKLLLTTLALTSVCACAFTACGKTKDAPHTHSYAESVVAPTCTERGYTLHSCACGDSYKDGYVDAGHTVVADDAVDATCTSTGLTQGSHCSACGEVFAEQRQIPLKDHNYKDGVCTDCRTHAPTQNLIYTKVDGGYELTGTGFLKDTEIYIAAVYENEPVISIGECVFSGHEITSVTIPDSVTSIGNQAFEQCGSLTSVSIGKGVTEIGDFAFDECENLTEIYYTGDIASWCAIGGIGDSRLMWSRRKRTLYINGKELTGKLIIPDNITAIGDYAFEHCGSITSVTIPDGVTVIGEAAFENCSALTSVTIPDDVTFIGCYAFSGTSLTSVILPDGISSVEEGVFYSCKSLTSVTVPDSVTSIDYYAFGDCAELKTINFKGTKAQWNAVKKYNKYWMDGAGDFTVRCTDGKLDKNGDAIE